MKIQPYLFFNGRCDEAIAFYGKALGATVNGLMRFMDSEEAMKSGQVPPEFGNKVMHASLHVGAQDILVSDGMSTDKQNFQGVSLTLTAEDDAQAEKLFAALGDGGQVRMPMGPTFFASRFGMLTDRFGVSWMVMSGQQS